MAFNPMANFQKYKKIWMTSLILVAMVTFVLCSGFGDENSGLQGWINRLSRGKGEVVARIDGSRYYREHFQELKENREIANKYMRKVMEQSSAVLQDYLKQPEEMKRLFGDREVTKRDEGILLLYYRQYMEKLKNPRFFEGTNKLNDLVDFQVWLAEADRLKIYLADKDLSALVASEAFLYIPAQDKESEPIRGPLISSKGFADISRFVQGTMQGITDDRIQRALRDEMRVRLAKMVLLEGPNLHYSEILDQLFRRDTTEKAMAPRVSLTPDEWYRYYKKNRATFNVELVPIDATQLAKTVAAPKDEELVAFFNAHKSKPEDITSDETGLQYPRERFTVHFLMADPKSPRFKNKAETVLALQLTPPVVWNPMMPPLLNHLNYPLADALAGKLIERRVAERSAARTFDIIGAGRVGDQDYATSLLAWMARKDPPSQAALANMAVSGLGDASQILTSLPLFVEQAKKVDEKAFVKELSRQIEEERKLLMPIYATFMGMTESPYLALTPATLALEPSAEFFVHFFGQGFPDRDLDALVAEKRTLPLSFYFKEEWDKLVQERATDYVRNTMKEVREILTGRDVVGTQSKLDVNLKTRVLNTYGVTLVSSKKPYTVHEMERAPELEPLRKAYEEHSQKVDFFEGRRDDKQLTGKSFASALFFSSGEKYSVEGRSYTPRAWPPDLEMQQSKEVINLALAYVENKAVDGKKMDRRMGENLEFAMKSADPRAPKEPVSLFTRADNPILFWKEDPPKGDPTPRWETEINKDVERLVTAMKGDLEKRIARVQAEAGSKKENLEKTIDVLRNGFKKEEESIRKKAKEQVEETRERTLRAYKLTEARDKLAPEMVRKIATDLAATGGESVLPGPYRDLLAKLERETIVLRDLAPWYRTTTKAGDYEYRDFTLSQADGVVLPRADMAKKLLELPNLDKPIEVKYGPIDDLNKELFNLSKKAFEQLKADKKTIDAAPRIVQVIPNKSRTVYYIALLTSTSNPPSPSFKDFEESIAIVHGNAIDPFLARAYQEASKQWREDVVQGLRRRLNVTVEENEAAKGFESDSGGE